MAADDDDDDDLLHMCMHDHYAAFSIQLFTVTEEEEDDEFVE